MAWPFDQIYAWFNAEIAKIVTAIETWVGAMIVAYDLWFRPLIYLAIDGIADSITKLEKEIAFYMYKFQKWIAEYMATDVGFLVVIGACILAVVALPYIYQFLQSSGVLGAIQNIIAAIKTSLGTAGVLLSVVELKAISDLLKIFWPEYREVMKIFANAVAGMSEMLGYGTGMLTAIFGSCKGIFYSLGNLSGVDAFAKEAMFYEGTHAFMGKIDERFKKYAYDPGALLDDYIDEIIIPVSQDATFLNTQFVTDLEDARVKVDNNIEDILNIVVQIDNISAALPDEISLLFDEKWGPIRDSFNTIISVLKTTVFNRVDEVLDIFNEYRDRQEVILANIAARTEIVSEYIYGIENEFPDDIEDFFLWLSGKQYSQLDKNTLAYMPLAGADQFLLNVVGGLSNLPEFTLKLPEPPVVTPAVSLQPGHIPKPDFFVGEY